MSAETTKARIKIDNGTNFGRVYTDKTVDTKISGLQTAINGKAPKQTTGKIVIAKAKQNASDYIQISSYYAYTEDGLLTVDPTHTMYETYTATAVNGLITSVQSTANNANSTANTANNVANAAKATAETAQSTANACVKTVNIVSSQNPAGYSFNLVSADGKTTVGTILFDASLRPTISSDNQHVLRVSCPYTITFED